MLNITDLDFSFNVSTDSCLFKNLSLNVNQAEHVVIVGDSGGGKSTLLNAIADGGQSAIKLSSGKSATMVLQEGALLDHLNVIDNLRLIMRYSDKSVNDAEIVTILQQLGVDSNVYKADVSQLSGGQMRRVSIARALLTNPDLILFDEPDAGLDIVNLTRLAQTVAQLSTEQGKSSITVSHNPFYIAQVANKVYRLHAGKLILIADWPILPSNEQELQDRQLKLQNELNKVLDSAMPQSIKKKKSEWPVKLVFLGALPALISLFHIPKSPGDELRISAYVMYLSMISGLVFFALVGLMLGSTLIAVVRLLADSAISGLVSLFIKPETLIEFMGGRYVVYLAPAIGGMLFAARSGSIVTNWLGEMVRGKQVRALSLVGVNPKQYLLSPSLISMFVSMFIALIWFTICVWLGGALATQHLFEIDNVADVMSISQFDIRHSSFWMKISLYSVLTSVVVITLGMAKKKATHQVNIHTTKAIIYSTLGIAFTEMALILM